MPHRVGTCFHTCYCPLEPLELLISGELLHNVPIYHLSGIVIETGTVSSTQQRCVFMLYVAHSPTNIRAVTGGRQWRPSVTPPSPAWTQCRRWTTQTGPKEFGVVRMLLFGSGQISTVKWHWAIYFHTNAINTNTKTTSSSNTFIHSKWRWNRIYDRQIGPFLWPVWRSASNKAKRSEHSRWIHMTGGAEVWPNPRSIIGGDATELGDVHLVEPVLCELLWSWRNNKRGREKIQYRWTKSKRKVGVFQQFSIVEHNLPFNSSVLDSIGQVIGPCESCHCWFGHQ